MSDPGSSRAARPQANNADSSAPDAIDPGKNTNPLSVRLGRREREVMTVLWDKGSASVQEVAQYLSTALAYTTVMTTLDRLFKKGLLLREKKDRAFVYSAALSAQEVESQLAADLIRRFFDDSGEKQNILLSCLIDAVHQYDTKLLDELESEIHSTRARNLAAELAKAGGK